MNKYKVVFTFELTVNAEDESEAYDVASQRFDEEVYSSDADSVECVCLTKGERQGSGE